MEWLDAIIADHKIKAKDAGEVAKLEHEKKIKELEQKITATNHAITTLIKPLFEAVEAKLKSEGYATEITTTEREERQTKRKAFEKIALVISRSHSTSNLSDGLEPAFRIMININDGKATVSSRTNTFSEFAERTIRLENLTPTIIEPMLQQYFKEFFAVN
ncbi:hypothetical protein KI809_08370 [Geobacter pelophilus]|uniref:Uncharacterized protein n=1 Tax=Geoanaerobacter pelophilus TaxID=60036 RepID=A0AAW4L8G2_9BACT|nr:hypothetical protein [Geoanaerobacter pelophilus]MBT0664314.1 hypothetical protein [Geoanaerobacter pelophilus]